MISIDFSLGIALYLLLFLSTMLIMWLLGAKLKDKDLSIDPRFIWFCSICTCTYVFTKEDAISVCPRCGSFNKK